MYKYLIIIFVFVQTISAKTQEKHLFRVYFSDKNDSKYTLENPSEFLSEKAIERRRIQKLELNESDLPISEKYITTLKNLGFDIKARSKWMNTVGISAEDSLDIKKIENLPFVKDILWVGKTDTLSTDKKKLRFNDKPRYPKSKTNSYYGYASDQIFTVNGQTLHEKGYWGENKEIAIIDVGFKNLKEILYLGNIDIKGIKDFVGDGSDLLTTSEHGLSVLSAMATNQPNIFVGTAPKASYWLFRSENEKSEYPIEEDYWVTAVEYADSVGVDIINTSLGYQDFNPPAKSYVYEEMDGKTSFMSRAAGQVADKGMLLVVSAGNEGNMGWRKITVPADAENVITVGSMFKDSIVSDFSSMGPTADGRIKPDVIALGEDINLLDSRGEIIKINGTSFAAPVITGLAACLWEAYPTLTSKELINIICSSSNMFNKPGIRYGYGIPDMNLAFDLAKDISTGIEEELPIESSKSDSKFIYKSDSIGHINIKKSELIDKSQTYHIQIYSLNGSILINEEFNDEAKDLRLNDTSKRAYIIYIFGYNLKESKKLFF